MRESSALYQSDLFLGADPLVLHVEELRNPGIEIGVPPSSFSVPPGAGEALVLNPVGEQGYTYAFRLEVDVIVDGSESTEMVDDGGAPFRFGFASG